LVLGLAPPIALSEFFGKKILKNFPEKKILAWFLKDTFSKIKGFRGKNKFSLYPK